MKQRLTKPDGFTLAETLLAVLILLLVSGIVATGVPVARNVYYKTVLSANAQVMLSTAVTALRDELGTAWKVEILDENNIRYYSAETGWKSIMTLKMEKPATDSKGREYLPISVSEYVTITNGNMEFSSTPNAPHSLVPDKNSDMFVRGSAFKCSNGNIVLETLEVVLKDDISIKLADLSDVIISVVSDDVKDLSSGGGV